MASGSDTTERIPEAEHAVVEMLGNKAQCTAAAVCSSNLFG